MDGRNRCRIMPFVTEIGFNFFDTLILLNDFIPVFDDHMTQEGQTFWIMPSQLHHGIRGNFIPVLDDGLIIWDDHCRLVRISCGTTDQQHNDDWYDRYEPQSLLAFFHVMTSFSSFSLILQALADFKSRGKTGLKCYNNLKIYTRL